jgi:hypothetical protein
MGKNQKGEHGKMHGPQADPNQIITDFLASQGGASPTNTRTNTQSASKVGNKPKNKTDKPKQVGNKSHNPISPDKLPGKQHNEIIHQFAKTCKIEPTGYDPDFCQSGENNEVDPKGDFSAKELKFLDLYFSPDKKKPSIEKMLKMAGFRGGHNKTAKRILDKFCAKTDPREIFRRVGLSEESIAVRLLAIADDSTVAAGTRVQALSIASKCIGLQREIETGAAGARIIITSAEPVQNPTCQEGRPTPKQAEKPNRIIN